MSTPTPPNFQLGPLSDAFLEAGERWKALGGTRRLFDAEFPGVTGLQTTAIWIAGDLLEFDGDFDKLVRGRDLVKQEGLIFRHVLRLVLLCGEFAQSCPAGISSDEWQTEMRTISESLSEACLSIDAESTQKVLEAAAQSADYA